MAISLKMANINPLFLEGIMNPLRLFHEIFNTKKFVSPDDSDVYANAYQDLTLLTDQQLNMHIAKLSKIRSDNLTSDSSEGYFSRQELAALHFSAIRERNNRKKNRLAFYTIVVGVIMGFVHIILN